MSHFSEQAIAGARNLVFGLGNLVAGERVCVVSDTDTRPLGELLASIAAEECAELAHVTVPPLPIHGTEPPEDVAKAMRASDLVLGITGKSLAHTQARVLACKGGARYLSLPEYDLAMFEHPALRIDFRRAARPARTVADLLTRASEIRIVSAAGTDVTLDTRGRIANFCPGYVDADHRLGSPPDIESNISPIEDRSRGIAVIDGSIAHPTFGRLATPVRLSIEAGRISAMDGDASTIRRLERLFDPYPANARVLAEFGIGFNPEATLSGNMLMDEGCYGTFHFGFGSNVTVGGANSVPFHVDFVFYASEFFADGERVRV